MSQHVTARRHSLSFWGPMQPLREALAASRNPRARSIRVIAAVIECEMVNLGVKLMGSLVCGRENNPNHY